MSLPLLHRTLDRLAMWAEDRISRQPQPYRPGTEEPLACFGPLGSLPSPPAGAGPWQAPSPFPAAAPNDRMQVHCTLAEGPRRGTLLLVPPWKIARTGLVSGYINLFARAGFEVWLLVPPHHLERTAPGQRSGEGFVSLDLGQLRARLEQLVLEIRLCAAMARERGQVGLLGLSLGGLAAALATTGPEPLDFAAMVAPTNLMAVLTATPIGHRYRRLAHRAGTPLPPLNVLGPSMAPLDPAGRAPTARRLFIAAGLLDCISPPAETLVLARAWRVEPALYPRGHLSLLFLCRRLRGDLLRFATARDPAER